MSAHTANAHESHDDHAHAGPDPMAVKIGALIGLIVLVVVIVSVFAYSGIAVNAKMFTTSKVKEPVVLPAQEIGLLGNSCDTFVFEQFFLGSKRCR